MCSRTQRLQTHCVYFFGIARICKLIRFFTYIHDEMHLCPPSVYLDFIALSNAMDDTVGASQRSRCLWSYSIYNWGGHCLHTCRDVQNLLWSSGWDFHIIFSFLWNRVERYNYFLRLSYILCNTEKPASSTVVWYRTEPLRMFLYNMSNMVICQWDWQTWIIKGVTLSVKCLSAWNRILKTLFSSICASWYFSIPYRFAYEPVQRSRFEGQSEINL